MARKPIEWSTGKLTADRQDSVPMGKLGTRNRHASLRDKEPHAPMWWKLDAEHTPAAILATVQHIKNTQTSMEMQRSVCTRLYGGSTPGTAYGINLDRMQLIHPSLTGRLTYNICAIVVDSMLNKITKNKVRPMFLTEGGSYRQQRRAKRLTQFAEGIFYETKFDTAVAPRVAKDAYVVGDGFIHVYPDWATKRVRIERTMASELFVDTIDGFYGEPCQMTRAKNIDRQKVLESFGRKEDGKPDRAAIEAINRCKNTGKELFGSTYQFVDDGIAVFESWHLPTTPDSGDGLHTICIDGYELFREEWKKAYFPFVKVPWKDRMYGWHGGSLVEELIGTQVEMNYLLNMMQRAFRMMAAFKIVTETGTVPDAHFNDKLGTIIKIPKGAMTPQYLTPPAINPQFFEHFERIKSRGFEIARISQLSATGLKPAGLDSGEAQRVYHDIESEGLQVPGHIYEQMHLDVIRLAIDVVRDIFAEKKSYKIKAPVSSSGLPGLKFLKEIDWKDVQMEDDEYVLRAYPMSALPSTPAGRLATINDLARGGFIDGPTARKLMDFPDLSQVETLLGSAENWVMKCLDKAIEDAEFDPPDELMNLQLAETLCVQEISAGEAAGLEDDNLSVLRDWLQQVKYLQGKAATAAPQAAQPADVGSSAGIGVIPEMGQNPMMTGGAMQSPPGAMPPGMIPGALQ